MLLAPILPRWVAAGGRPRPLWVVTLLLVGTGLWGGGLRAVLEGRRFRDVSPSLRTAMLALVILVVPVSLLVLAILVAVD